jgi:hypothetical protein
MSLDALIMLLGALVAVMPFLGFTVNMQMWILFVLGIIIIGLGIAVRRRGQKPRNVRARKGEFVESIPSGIVSYDIEARHDPHSHDDDQSVA